MTKLTKEETLDIWQLFDQVYGNRRWQDPTCTRLARVSNSLQEERPKLVLKSCCMSGGNTFCQFGISRIPNSKSSIEHSQHIPNYIITMSDDGFLEKHCSYSSIPPHESQSRTQSTQAAFAKMQQNRFIFRECSLSGANTSGTKCKIHLQDLQ